VTPFSASFHSLKAAAVVAVSGEFDLAAITQYRAARAEAMGADGALIVDLTDCTFIDSTGIAAVIRTFERADKAGRPFALVASSSQVRRVLELVGIPGRVPWFERLDDALAELAPA
jgi:anti-sigma B factor antagonist